MRFARSGYEVVVVGIPSEVHGPVGPGDGSLEGAIEGRNRER